MIVSFSRAASRSSGDSAFNWASHCAVDPVAGDDSREAQPPTIAMIPRQHAKREIDMV